MTEERKFDHRRFFSHLSLRERSGSQARERVTAEEGAKRSNTCNSQEIQLPQRETAQHQNWRVGLVCNCPIKALIKTQLLTTTRRKAWLVQIIPEEVEVRSWDQIRITGRWNGQIATRLRTGPMHSASGSDMGSRSNSDPLEKTLSLEAVRSGGEVDVLPSGGTRTAADIPTTLGRFKIHGVLGTGGFGTVYLGFDDRLKRKVAIKVPIGSFRVWSWTNSWKKRSDWHNCAIQESSPCSMSVNMTVDATSFPTTWRDSASPIG